MFPTEIIVLQVNHYDMTDNRGLNVRIVGSHENSGNKFGLSVSESPILKYEELEYLKRYADSLPARFKANMHMVTKKANNGKEITSAAFTDLQFVNSVEIVDKKKVS